MSSSINVLRNTDRMMSPDPAKIRQALAPPTRNFISYGRVGYVDSLLGIPEPTPNFVRVENGQFLVECTLEPQGDKIVARLGMDGAGAGVGEYTPLSFGCRVVIEFINGSPSNAVIVASLNDGTCRTPGIVAGVLTGADAAAFRGVAVPAPMWRFIKLGIGQMMAIETQAGGDILIHSAASVEIKAGPSPAAAIHLNGTTHLGVGPTTPPVGALSGPSGTEIPGVPAVPHVPIPVAPAPPAAPNTIVPYIGSQDGIIRAKDGVQSTAALDPAFWAWVIAVSAAVIPPIPVPPTALHSEHSGRNGPGSSHTASD